MQFPDWCKQARNHTHTGKDLHLTERAGSSVHLWFPSTHHILIREKDWDDIQWSGHPLMALQTGLTQEEGLLQEIHLNSLSKSLLFMY